MSNPVKILLFLLIAACIATGSLWFVGGKKRGHSTTILIKARPGQVFPYLVESNLRKKWVPGLMDIIPITEGGFSEDAMQTLVVTQDDETERFREVVIRFEKNENLSLRAIGDSVVITSIFRLESEGDETRLFYKINNRHRGFSRVMAPFEDDAVMQQQVEDIAMRLKTLVEQEIAERGGGASGISAPAPDASNEENQTD